MSDEQQIINLVDQLNEDLYVPDIQRDYEWNRSDIISFFDSLLCDYPVGMIILWNYEGQFDDLNAVYEFVEKWSTKPSYKHDKDDKDEKDDSNSQHAPPLLDDLDNGKTGKDLLESRTTTDDFKLVVDGQQRLTSLLIGMQGSVQTETSKYQLFVDLNQDVNERLNRDTGSRDELSFDIEFKPSTDSVVIEETDDRVKIYYNLSNITDADLNTEHEFISLKSEIEPEISEKRSPEFFKEHSDSITGMLSHISSKLINNTLPVREYSTPSFDEILQLFLRINTKGEQLTDSDVLMSVITTQWGTSENPMNAREKIREFQQKLDQEHSGMFKPDPKHVTLPLLLPIDHKNFLNTYENDEIETISNLSPDQIRETKQVWENYELLQAISDTFKFIEETNYNQFLGTKNKMYHLYPIIYFFYCEDNIEYSTNIESDEDYVISDLPADQKNTLRLMYWLSMSNLTDEFTSMKDIDKIAKIYEIIQQESGDGMFPLKKIDQTIDTSLTRLTNYKVSDAFERKSLSGTTGMSVLALLRHPRLLPKKTHIDHLQPKTILTDEEKLVENYGIEVLSEYNDYAHRMSNRAVLPQKENTTKNAMELKDYLNNVEDQLDTQLEFEQFLDSHCLPHDEKLWAVENFPEFRRKRTQLIKEKLKDKFQILYEESETQEYPSWCK